MVKCRNCNGDLSIVFSLGEMYPSGFVQDQEQLPNKAQYSLGKCNSCGLVQLSENYNIDDFYKKQYFYQSGLNSTMRAELKAIVDKAMELQSIYQDDVVLDIGANDGTLLGFYPETAYRVGFDPAPNLKRNSTFFNTFINDYYPCSFYSIPEKAKIITSIAMLYDLTDPNAFISAVKKDLAKYGIWIIQYTDLYSMLRMNDFTNICLEHIEYYSTNVIRNMLKAHGLDIFDIEYNKVNGGSVRLYVCHSGTRAVSPKVETAIATEEAYLNNPTLWLEFHTRIEKEKAKLLGYLWTAKGNGKTIGMLGASTKANTLLQYMHITSELISFAGEINSDKFGKMTLGSWIPIIPEEKMFERKPDILFLGIWQFTESLLQKASIKEYIDGGGEVVVGLPEFRVYKKEPRVEEKSLGELIDQLITADIKAFVSQDKLMESPSEKETARFARIAQESNALRNKLIRAIDGRLEKTFVSPSEKTYLS